jgi:hypothetical protein
VPEAPQASRALLFPGPLEPLSHFGVTLLRHAVASGLRYSFYHLGLPLPEPPPLRIAGLRLYLDGPALARLLDASPGGAAVAAAALVPGGAGGWPPGSSAVRAAAAFHRLRLLAERQPPRPDATAAADVEPSRRWRHFRDELSRLLAASNDALLSELVAALARRARRAAGKEAPPCLSLAAWRMRTGSQAPLGRFGPPDPLRPSWARAPERVPRALAAVADAPLPDRDPRRGRFREVWRLGLDRLSPIYFDLARSAVERGALGSLEEAFFLPFEVAEDLGGSAVGGWLSAAAARNRREHESALTAAEPPDLVFDPPAAGPRGPRPEWEWSPLLPLP